MTFIRAADCADPQDAFECPDCHSKKVVIEKDIFVTIWCFNCERKIADIDAAEWRERYEPPL